MLRIAEPKFSKDIKKSILKIIESGQLTEGKTTLEFESALKKINKTKYAIATNSGTAALFMVLNSLHLKAGSEVITTPFSFIATANTILLANLKPVFCDIERQTFNIDPDCIEKHITNKTQAILTVDLYGLPCDYQKIRNIAKKNNLFLISDSCQAIGSKYRGQPIAKYTDATIFSFYATKNITTIEGGAIVTNDSKIDQFCRAFKNHGISPKTNRFISPGFNYRTTELASAIGINQLKFLEKWIKVREKNFKLFNHLLKDVPGIITPNISPNLDSNFHLYTIRVTNKFPISRTNLISLLKKNGIESRIYYDKPLSRYKFMPKTKTSIKNAQIAAKEVLSLPIHPNIMPSDIAKIANIIKKCCS